jgi:hypothetical protein
MIKEVIDDICETPTDERLFRRLNRGVRQWAIRLKKNTTILQYGI